MCLSIDPHFHSYGLTKGQAFVAHRPILVWKRLNIPTIKGGKAPYRGTPWLFGVMKTIRNFTYDYDNTEVEAGLHAFYTTKAYRAYGSMFPAIIPTGARFFLGKDGEIVSTKLTVYRDMNQLKKAHGVTELGAPIYRKNLTKRSR